MKKQLLSLMLMLATLTGMNAERYYVYSGGRTLGEGETAMSVDNQVWGEGGQGGLYTAGYKDGENAIYMQSNWGGWSQFAFVASSFDATLLKNDNLTFNFKVMSASEGNVEIALRVRGENDTHFEAKKTLEFAHDGLWHPMCFNVKEVFGTFYDALNDSADMDVPYVTITGQPAGSTVAIADMYFDTGALTTPVICATCVTDITHESAKVGYSSILPTGATNVKYYLNDNEISENPCLITGLTPETEYAYTLKVEAMVNGRTVTGEDKVKIITIRDPQKPYKYHLAMDGIVKNATVDGTTRVDLPLSLECILSYNNDKSITVDMYVLGILPKGLGVKWSINNFDKQPLNKVDGEDNHFTVNTGTTTYEKGTLLNWMYAMVSYDGNPNGDETTFAYSRGSDSNYQGATNPYHVGDENDANIYGDPVALNIMLEETMNCGESQVINMYGEDTNGHYLFGEKLDVTIELEATGGDKPAFTFDSDSNTLICNERGNATLTFTSGNITATKEVKCITSSWSRNIFEGGAYDEDGKVLTVGERAYTINTDGENSTVKYLFDGETNDENKCLRWNFSASNDPEETNHYLEIEFDKPHKIERFSILWDGASAYDYYVYMYGAKSEPAGEAYKLSPLDDDTNIVWQGEEKDLPTGSNAIKVWHHLATNSKDDSGEEKNEGVVVSKVRIVPVRAYNHEWGVKLQELQLAGTDDEEAITTGVDKLVIEENGTQVTEYYNLQGVKVNNPTKGIYIMRQGNKTTKVML